MERTERFMPYHPESRKRKKKNRSKDTGKHPVPFFQE